MSVCTICDGVGLVRVMDPTGQWVSQACECQEVVREERRLASARVPERYRQYTLDGYETAFRGADSSLGRAHLTARRFVEAQVVGERVNALVDELESGGALGDFKSALQLHLQATGLGMPVYRLLKASGPDHLKHFEADVRVRSRDGEVGGALAVGSGASRKKAEQEAARRALALLTGEAKSAELLQAEPVS